MMRLFIALDLPEGFIPLLTEAGDIIARHAHKLSRTTPQNLHLTLRFLGDTAEERLPDLKRLIHDVPFGGRAALTHYGSFPTPDGLTLWAGLQCDEALINMAQAVEAGVRALDFPAEKRPFVPHVTLARRARLKAPLAKIIPLLPLHPQPLAVPALVLYQSVLGREGARYTAIERVCHAH